MPEKQLCSQQHNTALHAGTPIIVSSSRGLTFLRRPSDQISEAKVLVTRTVSCPLARTLYLYGNRTLDNPATDNADAVTVTGLAGQSLMLHTADGDDSLNLTDAHGRPLWSRNAQGTLSTVTYAIAADGGRPEALTEVASASAGRVREKYIYASLTDTVAKVRNLAGTMVAYHDNGGITRPHSLSLTGQPLQSDLRLLKPEIMQPDWAILTESDMEDTLTVFGSYDASGAQLTDTNAAGVTSVTTYDICGNVWESRIRYQHKSGLKEVITQRDIIRQADGRVLSQMSGNGISDRYEYDPYTHYLTCHLTERPNGHPLGERVISDLHYTYDPAGNILALEDKGADPDWHGGTVATGMRIYMYDTLYRLVSATGRELTSASRYRTQPAAQADGTAGRVWKQYTQQYDYDDGGNLTSIMHTGGNGDLAEAMAVATGSNRAVKKGSAATPEEGFLAGGLQKHLPDGRVLLWHADSQLMQVSPVTRTAETTADDSERYHYASGGMRTRKIRTVMVSGGTQDTITTYAGGAETRLRQLEKTHQLDIVITDSGGVRLIHNRLTGDIHLRYGFSDHLNSCGGEADTEGNITSREEYLPYGGSAGADEEMTEVTNRTCRYSGKERDVTGLLYYGWRYHQPVLGRWLSADPGGLVDGVNLFRFCRNNPLNMVDNDGKSPVYHYIEPRAARTEFEEGMDKPFYKMSVGFKVPKKYKLSSMAQFYLNRSQKGNIFTGVVAIETGKIYMYPTSTEREGSGDSFGWQTEYEGEHHDGGINIIHSPEKRPSHTQVVDKINETKKTDRGYKEFIGFTYYDLRDIRKDVAGITASHQSEMSVIYGRSRSLNGPHMTRLGDDGMPERTSAGVPLGSPELPIEIKRGILDAFKKLAKNDVKKLLNEESNSPDFDVNYFDTMSKKYNEFKMLMTARNATPAAMKVYGNNGRMYF